MNKSSTRGIFLSLAILFSVMIFISTPNVFAEEVSVKSFALDETTIIEVTNESDDKVNTFRIWLPSDISFKSFKTEQGWVGEKTPQGVIIFKSTESIKPGESVKFGVKTDEVKPGINWKALDDGDKQMDIGKVLPGELPKATQITKPKQEQTPSNIGETMSAESTFRIVPEKPNIGSTVRVTGDNFGASQEFDFYIDSKKIGSFVTDENGHFMTTMKIPDSQKADRADFKIKDKDGEEKTISLRIGEIESRIPESQNVKLTLKGLPDVIHRGDFLEIFGTGEPGGAITAKISNPDGEVINSRTAEIDTKGNWELEEPIIVALDAEFGKYSATITDGRESIQKQWEVKSDKIIIMTPSSLKFEPGEIMKFNGTALPNQSIELSLEDPLGNEVATEILDTDDAGFVEFEFQTSQSTSEGTWTLIATQDKEKEFIFAGVGQLPTIPVNVEFDKLSYKSSETAIISLTGKGSDVISLLIIDPSDKPKGDAITIELQPDGRGTYNLELTGYSSGVYTAVISKGSTQNEEVFAVGLQTGSGEIDITTTKFDYLPGDSILILGETSPNSLITVTLLDPEGNELKTKETFSAKDGRISESSFRIPSDASPGVWIINAKSGGNFDNTELEVLATLEEGLQVSAEQLENEIFGKFIQIKVTGAQQTVQIEIIDSENTTVDNLTIQASGSGEIDSPWIIPEETEPGSFTIKVTDAVDTAETTFELQ